MINFEHTQKIIFSSPLNKNEKFTKLSGRKIKIKEKDYIQFEGFYNNKAFHENILIENLREFFGEKILLYKQADIYLNDSHYMAFNKNGEISFHKTKNKTERATARVAPTNDHNRSKNYIINEGDNIPILIELGIFNKDFRVIKGMYNKFKQINNFVEIIDATFKNTPHIPPFRGDDESGEVMRILDFGCGNSYLTFVIYYYFTQIKKIPVNITGIDIQQDIINHCLELAEMYNYTDLYFKCSDIKDYEPEFKPDMIISLHGCNTATDYAIYNGIKWGVEYIFVAPCCQKEINKQMKRDDLRELYAPLRYGVLKDRFSSLITDGLRANMLEIFDYKTDVAEFVGFNHSPKNILIKAVKSKHETKYKQLLKDQSDKFIADFNIDPTLYKLLGF